MLAKAETGSVFRENHLLADSREVCPLFFLYSGER